MVEGVGHIGILVRDLDQSARLYQELFGATLHEVKVIEEQGVRVGMLSFQRGPHLELLEPLPNSRMAAALEKRGEGVQHISFDVDDIEKDLASLKDKKVSLLDESPRQGVEGKVAFLHPRSVNGVLVELCQKE
jgi:methylmalonyl-CoA epimerase